jgi:abortive phage resistance protein AbiGi (putative antitoxin)
MNYDYAIHSDFLIHWTGKDIDSLYDKQWYESSKSKTKKARNVNDLYIKRLYDILKYGLWMTEEQEKYFSFGGTDIVIPSAPITCFTELKLSESRKHAKNYGRLGIGVKRNFLFDRSGRPLTYFRKDQLKNDIFLQKCSIDLKDKNYLNFFKPMNSTSTLNYDLYGESEWRVLYFKELLTKKLIKDPRDSSNVDEYNYFNSLASKEKDKLKYLIPLDGWFAMIIYPSLDVKNSAQQDSSKGILDEIERIKKLHDRGNVVENGNRPIEVDLDACRNF